MKIQYTLILIFLFSCSELKEVKNEISKSNFRISPYIQNSNENEVSIIWFSNTAQIGNLTYWVKGTNNYESKKSSPVFAKTLNYTAIDHNAMGKHDIGIPYKHHISLKSLKRGKRYNYKVIMNKEEYSGQFLLPSKKQASIHFIVLADTETEPESKGKFAKWGNHSNSSRKYLIDQNKGLINNLKLISKSKPDFIIIPGDLVESGGEQRDWDEFWKHFASLGARSYIFPALGNHEYFAGPIPNKKFYVGYAEPLSGSAVKKYLTYFEPPNNNAPFECMKKRYYAVNFGVITLIALDGSTGGKEGSKYSTSKFLSRRLEQKGGCSPSLAPGSIQYKWLEKKLKEAQKESQFTFITFHNIPYSVGSHARKNNLQAGPPLQFLNKLFLKYGVDAVFSGHDEMYERSLLKGFEEKSNGIKKKHSIHYYDIGIGGDGLRPPKEHLINPYQKFLAFSNAPEVWRGKQLIDGGRHYGHLDVVVTKDNNKKWTATLTPIYSFPVSDKNGEIIGFERRIYKDKVILQASK